MYKIIGGAGFVGSRLKVILENNKVFDKILIENEGYVDITKSNTLRNKVDSSDSIVLLAAEHRDDVSPISKYYETNVQGTKNILDEMDKLVVRI